MVSKEQITLRCYLSQQENNQWCAVCIDLCLAVQADSKEMAKSKLHSMIKSYVIEAHTIHREYKDQLMNRKAPWTQVLFYHYIKLCKKVFHIFSEKYDVFKDKENIPVCA